MTQPIDIFSYAFGNAAHDTNCKHGPLILQTHIQRHCTHLPLHWHTPLCSAHRHQQLSALHDVAHLCSQLSYQVKHAVLHQKKFITLGGDHSSAIGTWSGAANCIHSLGLIWFDAHMDAHTFQTTPSFNIHGMPLAALLGYGDAALTKILSTHPKLLPENVVLIGVRSYESGEAALLASLGVTIFFMEDIKKLGLKKVIEQAIDIVTRNTQQFGITIDLDGFDPIDAPGVGSPAIDGIRSNDFLPLFSHITTHPQLIGAEIVEFNPARDVNDVTLKLAVKLVEIIGA